MWRLGRSAKRSSPNTPTRMLARPAEAPTPDKGTTRAIWRTMWINGNPKPARLRKGRPMSRREDPVCRFDEHSKEG
eukprot:10145113-Lingulodinium_polyedra.AAC.1